MPRIVIGLMGKRGSGKTTVANYLKEKYNFIEFTFAGPLKQAIQALFGFSDLQLNDPELKEQVDPYWKVSPRQVLQVVGTECIRDTLPLHLPQLTQVFIRNVIRSIEQTPEDARIVISDCRMPDEFRMLRQLNSFLIKVSRPVASNQDHLTKGQESLTPFTKGHSSETSLDNTHIFTPDIVFLNDQSLEYLYQQVDRYLKLLLQPKNLF